MWSHGAHLKGEHFMDDAHCLTLKRTAQDLLVIVLSPGSPAVTHAATCPLLGAKPLTIPKAL